MGGNRLESHKKKQPTRASVTKGSVKKKSCSHHEDVASRKPSAVLGFLTKKADKRKRPPYQDDSIVGPTAHLPTAGCPSYASIPLKAEQVGENINVSGYPDSKKEKPDVVLGKNQTLHGQVSKSSPGTPTTELYFKKETLQSSSHLKPSNQSPPLVYGSPLKSSHIFSKRLRVINKAKALTPLKDNRILGSYRVEDPSHFDVMTGPILFKNLKNSFCPSRTKSLSPNPAHANAFKKQATVKQHFTRSYKQQLRRLSAVGASNVQKNKKISSFLCISSFILRRCLLEDTMCLGEHSSILILVCADHPSFMTTYQRVQESIPEGKRLPTVQLRHKTFLQLQATVAKNCRMPEFENGLMSHSEFLHLMGVGGGSIGVSFNGSTISIEMKFSEIYSLHQTIHIWAELPYKRCYRTAFTKLKNPESQQKLFSRLVSELDGDYAQLFDVGHNYLKHGPKLKTAEERETMLPLLLQQGVHVPVDPAPQQEVPWVDLLFTIPELHREDVDGLGEAVLPVPPAQPDEMAPPQLPVMNQHLDRVIGAAILTNQNLPSFTGKVVEMVTLAVDRIYEDAILSTFGEFTCITSPIVTQKQVQHMVGLLKSNLPSHFECIDSLLGFQTYRMQERSIHKHVGWDRMVFYYFLLIARFRSNFKLLPNFALVNYMSHYAVSSGGKSLRISQYFGLTCSRTTMLRRLADHSKHSIIDSKIIHELMQLSFIIAIFDNLQRGQNLKFQRCGLSNQYLVMTARCFVEATMKNNPLPFVSEGFYDTKVNLTFMPDQPIPSPYGLPEFENSQVSNTYLLGNYETCYTKMAQLPHGTADFTGKRVQSYMDIILLAETLQSFQQNLSTTKEYSFLPKGSRRRQKIVSVLRKCRGLKGLFNCAHKFQKLVVLAWRGETSKASTLSPPVQDRDETTLKGAAGAILDLLRLAGMIVRSTLATGPTWVLANDFEKRWFILAGDGLSYERFRTFAEKLCDCQRNFKDDYEQCRIFSQVLAQVVFLPGDLHGGRFHTLSAIYNLFYGGLLQPIQFKLGWKKICGRDVMKTFQQCKFLFNLVFEEAERIVNNLFIENMPEQQFLELQSLEREGQAVSQTGWLVCFIHF
jgi:hypothetical protein